MGIIRLSDYDFGFYNIVGYVNFNLKNDYNKNITRNLIRYNKKTLTKITFLIKKDTKEGDLQSWYSIYRCWKNKLLVLHFFHTLFS